MRLILYLSFNNQEVTEDDPPPSRDERFCCILNKKFSSVCSKNARLCWGGVVFSNFLVVKADIAPRGTTVVSA